MDLRIGPAAFWKLQLQLTCGAPLAGPYQPALVPPQESHDGLPSLLICLQRPRVQHGAHRVLKDERLCGVRIPWVALLCGGQCSGGQLRIQHREAHVVLTATQVGDVSDEQLLGDLGGYL